MNCRESQEWLQSQLDSAAGPVGVALAEHLRACPDCGRLHAAARRLRQGLFLLTPPAAPSGLARRVVAGVLAGRRQRQRWRLRLAGGVTLAASLLLIVAAGRDRPRPAATPLSAQRTPTGRALPQTLPSLRASVAAVAGLTSRTLDRAVEGTRGLLPVVDASVLPPMELQPFEGPSYPLREAGENVATGLEPLGDAAWRAIALFRRELPLQSEKKPGL